MTQAPLRIGTAGWALPANVRACFPEGPNNLARYAGRLTCAEINSSFYRSHKPATYARWAEATPADFRFSVKCPKAITHQARLADCADAISAFADESAALDVKRGVVLVQLPPSLTFDAALIAEFFRTLSKAMPDTALACEPRHASWGSHIADRLLADFGVARVAADPARFDGADEPGGARDFAYYRLHGSPRLYYSSYDGDRLVDLAKRTGADDWVIFDNTASGAATADALALSEMG